MDHQPAGEPRGLAQGKHAPEIFRWLKGIQLALGFPGLSTAVANIIPTENLTDPHIVFVLMQHLVMFYRKMYY